MTPGKTLVNLRACYSTGNEQVGLLGADISAEDVAKLQADFGYLIAPALEDAGLLHLLPAKQSEVCTDAEQLAAFARSFAVSANKIERYLNGETGSTVLKVF